jgi:ABC-type multidrug transport system ATPase subunit
VVGVLYEGNLVTEGSPTELTERMEAEEGTTLEDVFLSVTAERGPVAAENTGDPPANQGGRETAVAEQDSEQHTDTDREETEPTSSDARVEDR